MYVSADSGTKYQILSGCGGSIYSTFHSCGVDILLRSFFDDFLSHMSIYFYICYIISEIFQCCFNNIIKYQWIWD